VKFKLTARARTRVNFFQLVDFLSFSVFALCTWLYTVQVPVLYSCSTISTVLVLQCLYQ
jgi:hypothetical protein